MSLANEELDELEDVKRLTGGKCPRVGHLSTGRHSPASDKWGLAVSEFTDREMYLIKRALAIATLAVERATERSHADDADMKALLVKLVEFDVELVMYVREARIALTGELEPAQVLVTPAGTGGRGA